MLSEAGIDIVYPHEFAASTVAAQPEADIGALLAMSRRMTTPSRTPRELLDELRARYAMDGVARFLSPRLEEVE